MTSTTASAIRPSLRDNRALSGSPHTPSRFISSNFSSPGSTFRQEEDAVIIDLDPRRLYAGFEGESGAQCMITFNPENSRRVGDYRNWLPDYRRKQGDPEHWASGYELWQNDLKGVDLGLLEDKMERAVREAYNKHLLTDAGTARLVLVLPSLVPYPVLSSILTMLFERWRYSSITLLPAPTMTTVAAGLRSALVVDIGWEETVITPVYEYRELPSSRSTRAMRDLMKSVGESLKPILAEASATTGATLRFDFDVIEDFILRALSCEELLEGHDADLATHAQHLSVGDQDTPANISTIPVEWPSDRSSHLVHVPRSTLSTILSHCLLTGSDQKIPDDHEQPVGRLIYSALLALSPDIRSVCMARIVFTGQGSHLAGLKQQIIIDVQSSIKKHGWTAVRGTRLKPARAGLTEIAQGRAVSADARYDTFPPPGKDYVEEKLQKQRAKDAHPSIQGEIREVDTLGSWAGASLTTSMKVRGFVEIERERFMSHGLSGATRETEISVVPQRMSTFGAGATKGIDRTSWTLAGWG